MIVPCCYHHLTEKCDFEEEKLENITSQFETGLARGLATDELTSTSDLTEETFIGFPLSNALRGEKLGRNTRMLACHSKRRTRASYHPDRDVRSTKDAVF